MASPPPPVISSVTTAPPVLNDTHAQLALMVSQCSGIRMKPAQTATLQARLARRLHHLHFPDLPSYLEHLQSTAGAEERKRMISTLTINVTQFFREPHHFDCLRHQVLPDLLDKARCGKRVRIWSAGSSSGQEAFSIAMVIADMAADFAARDIRILATDIDMRMISAGRTALYPTETLASVPARWRQRFFQQDADGARVIPDLRRIVRFMEHNLHDDWPMRGAFDVIFCRNVAIYFDRMAQRRLWQRLEGCLNPGGWLFLGHSERLPTDLDLKFINSGVTTYRQPAPMQTEIRKDAIQTHTPRRKEG